MAKLTIKEHEEQLKLFHRYMKQEEGKVSNERMEMFNKYATKYEEKIEQAKSEKVKSFDKRHYKIKGPNWNYFDRNGIYD